MLVDCVTPPCGSRRNGCNKGSVQQHMCHWRGCQCQPDMSSSSSSCRGTGEAHSCVGTPVGTGFLRHGPPCCRTGLAACGERGPLPCAPWPCFTGSHTSVPAGRQQPGSSGIASSANTLQTPQPPLCPHPRPCLPFLRQRHWEPAAAIPSPMNPAGVAGCHQTGLQRTPRSCAVWPFKKAYTSRFPRGKNKEASGADVILQCWAGCVSMSAGSWDLSRVKQGEAAWGCASLRRRVRAAGRTELSLGCVGVPAPRVLLQKFCNARTRI